MRASLLLADSSDSEAEEPIIPALEAMAAAEKQRAAGTKGDGAGFPQPAADSYEDLCTRVSADVGSIPLLKVAELAAAPSRIRVAGLGIADGEYVRTSRMHNGAPCWRLAVDKHGQNASFPVYLFLDTKACRWVIGFGPGLDANTAGRLAVRAASPEAVAPETGCAAKLFSGPALALGGPTEAAAATDAAWQTYDDCAQQWVDDDSVRVESCDCEVSPAAKRKRPCPAWVDAVAAVEPRGCLDPTKRSVPVPNALGPPCMC